MKNVKLQKFNEKTKVFFGKVIRRGKRIARLSHAENRKTIRVPSFWVLTIALILVSFGAVIYESVIRPKNVNYDGYDGTEYFVSQDWIDRLAYEKTVNEKSLAEDNMQVTSRESLRAKIKDMEKQIVFLQYLKDNDVPLLLKTYDSEDGESYSYYAQGYAYRFDNITFTMPDATAELPSFGELQQGTVYNILPDERSGDSVFETNLIFYFVAVLLIVLCFSDEFSTGTIKLVVSRPVSRRDIAVAKLSSVAAMMTLSWAISMVVYALFSLCFKNPVVYAAFNGNAMRFLSVTEFNLSVFVDILLVSYGFISLSAVFAVRFRNNIVAVILPFLVYFFKSLLVRVVRNLAVVDFFENLRLMEHFVLGNAEYGSTRIGQAVLTSIGIMLVLSALTVRKFKKFDMDKLK